jgi:DNA-binding winged helix-turn-helix (wHTH) protein
MSDVEELPLHVQFQFEKATVELDQAEHVLKINGTAVKIAPQALRLLCLLIRNAGSLVKREHIKEHFKETDDHNIRASVNRLRDVFGDKKKKLIQVQPTVGYRFTAEVFPVPRRTASTIVDLTSAVKDRHPPFLFGPPIQEPRYFFGRGLELNSIFNLWKHIPLQHAVVVGPQRSGKSSLLHYLMKITRTRRADLREPQRNDWLAEPERVRWVFVDFQDAHRQSQEKLLRFVLEELGFPTPASLGMSEFQEVMADRLQEPAIVVLDEIGVALEKFGDEFWNPLRSLTCHHVRGNLAWVAAAPEAPILLAQRAKRYSPFFNIFRTYPLGPMTPDEARELIASSPLPFSSADEAWILKESGRWPSLLQICCGERLLALNTGADDNAWRDKALCQLDPFRELLQVDGQ